MNEGMNVETQPMRLFRMISLNTTEQQFITHLDTFARSLAPPVECRIAGGWVRDKVSAYHGRAKR